ncbi:hypothetical protein AX15_002375 [Amanita polypyramis BW_CC]|nr:hypothetical protein AX15_002375 [Amanita polypyramis BW_CC]
MLTSVAPEHDSTTHVERLPPEILQSIFCDAVSVESHRVVLPHGLEDDPRTCLMRICSRWRAVALLTPELWNEVIIELGLQPSHALALASTVLSRARGLPVAVTARLPFHYYQPQGLVKPSAEELIKQIILPYAPSLKKLELVVPSTFVKVLLSQTDEIKLPVLESLSIQQVSFGVLEDPVIPVKLRMPSLKVIESGFPVANARLLDFFNSMIQSSQLTTFIIKVEPLPADVCYHILAVCPSLKVCSVPLDVIYADTRIALSTFTKLVMPYLEHFHVRFLKPEHSEAFLDLFRFPSIRDLAIKHAGDYVLGWTTPLTNFLLIQCGPSLEHLFIGAGSSSTAEMNTHELELVLNKYAVSLKRLFLPSFPAWVQPTLVQRLISRDLCVNLESLSFHFEGDADRWTETIAAAVKEAEAKGGKPVKELYVTIIYPGSLHTKSATLEGKFEKFVFHHASFSYNPVKTEKEWFGYFG